MTKPQKLSGSPVARVRALLCLLLVSPLTSAQLVLDPDFGDEGRVTTAVSSFTSDVVVAVATDSANRIYTGFGGAVGGVSRHDPDGELDPAFGDGGTIRVDFNVVSVAVQNDGKVIVAGSRQTSGVSSQDWVILRLMPDGSIDSAFGDSGSVVIDFEGQSDDAQTVMLAPDGRILVGGRGFLFGQGSAFAIAVLDSAGAVLRQQTFKLFDGSADIVTELLLQPDGQIVATGLARNFDGAVMAAIRVDANLALDMSFGTNGLTTVDFSSGPAEANAAVLLPDGSIVMGGYVEPSNLDRSLALVRLTPTGALDTTFGNAGRVEQGIGDDESETITDMLLFEGDVVVSVEFASTGDPGRFAALRFNDDGALVATFGSNGVAEAIFDGVRDSARALTIHEGAILVGGGAGGQRISEGSNLGLARFLTSGVLDNTFSVDGLSDTALIGPSNARARGAVFQPDGNIVVAGFVGVSFSERNFIVVRYLPDGSLDTNFGEEGIALTDLGNGEDSATALAIQPDGKLLVAGTVRVPPATSNDFGVVRYLPDGSLDQAFGQDGIVIVDIDGNSDSANAILVQPDGHIVLAGDARFPSLGSDQRFTLVRLAADGSLDPTFGTNGVASVSTGDSEFAVAVAMQNDGALLVGGLPFGGTNNRDFTIARFTPAGVLDASFGNAGIAGLDFNGEIDSLRDLLVVPNWNGVGERILAVGEARESSSASSSAFAAALFTLDGNLETAFGNAGIVTVDAAPGQLDFATAVAARGEGFVLVGDITVDAKRRFGAIGLTFDGQLDPIFSGNESIATVAFFDVVAQASAIDVSPSGNVIVAGETFDPDSFGGIQKFATAKFAMSDVLFRDGFEEDAVMR